MWPSDAFNVHFLQLNSSTRKCDLGTHSDIPQNESIKNAHWKSWYSRSYIARNRLRMSRSASRSIINRHYKTRNRGHAIIKSQSLLNVIVKTSNVIPSKIDIHANSEDTSLEDCLVLILL